jgi:CheY-like chemotaxis protein
MALFGKKKKTAEQIRAKIASLQQELELLGGASGAVDGEAQKDEQSETSNQSSSNALFATLSHELRTPLNGVLGMAQLLKEEVDSSKLETLESCAQHMQSVLHTLVNLSKIQKKWGDLPEHREWINLHDLMEQIKKNIGRRAISRRLKVQIEHADEGVRLRGDYDHLVHIIETALLGSLECTDINSGETIETLQVRWKVDAENVQIVIENPLEVMPKSRGYRIFQVTELTTGDSPERIRMEFLYWAVSISLLQHYDGAMVATKTGELHGVRTTLAFNMESMQASPTNQRPIGGLSLETSTAGANSLLTLPFCMKILVVEDDPINRELMALLLERVGQKTELARNGQEGLDLLAGGAIYDLILMDIDMPILDGMAAARAIRAGEVGEHAAETSIVALTAFNTLSDQSKFKSVGMDYFLSKPVALKDLRSILLEVAQS